MPLPIHCSFFSFPFSLGFWPKTEIKCILQHMALTHWDETAHPPLTKLKRTRKRKAPAKLIQMVSRIREASQDPELYLLCQPAFSKFAHISDLQWPQWRVNRKCIFWIFLILFFSIVSFLKTKISLKIIYTSSVER